MAFTDFNIHNIAPYMADHIGVYDKNGERVGKIEFHSSFKPTYDDRLYRVGLVSDTHYNDSDDSDSDPNTVSPDDSSQFDTDLTNAFQFFNEKESIDFVCCAGDITSDNYMHLVNFINRWFQYSPKTPFFSCKGNHDNAATATDSGAWIDGMDLVSMGSQNMQYINEQSGSYYFVKELPNGNKDVFIFLSIHYDDLGSSAVPNDTDNAIGDENRTHQYYKWDDIAALEELLEEYKHDRCFVFTHLFFKHKAGNDNNRESTYYKYLDKGRNLRYTLNGQQFIELNRLNNKYLNSIWFSGHSHYPWYWQKHDKDINICDMELPYEQEYNDAGDCAVVYVDHESEGEKCAYNIHIPSLARPLKQSNSYSIDLNRSEGGVMDVYENYVDIRGIVFKTNNSSEYTNKYTPIANYRLYVGGDNIKQID